MNQIARQLRIYVVSKVARVEQWHQLRAEGLPIISSWIDDGDEFDIDFSEAWQRYITEASSADLVLVDLEYGGELKGGMVEVGAALANGAAVFLIGEAPQFRTVAQHPKVTRFDTLADALASIDRIRHYKREHPVDYLFPDTTFCWCDQSMVWIAHHLLTGTVVTAWTRAAANDAIINAVMLQQKQAVAQKSYDILKVYFKFKLGRLTVQFRKLHMLSEPSGTTRVFTVSTDARPA